MKRITRSWLLENSACKQHVALFVATFGEAAVVSRANAIRAAQAGLDLGWLARRLLDGAALRAFEGAAVAALRAFEEARGALRRALEEAIDAAWRAYEEDATLRTFEVAADAAWRAYEEARAASWRALEEARAAALADALGLP